MHEYISDTHSLGVPIVRLASMHDRVQVVRIWIAFLALCELVTAIEIIIEQVENCHLHLTEIRF